MRAILIVFIVMLLVACGSSNSQPELKPDEVLITYQAVEDEQGSCRPTYQAITQKDEGGATANNIYMLRGKTEYFRGENKKFEELPFQIKVNRRETTTMFNEVVACADLHIKVTVTECEFQMTDRESCPPISVKGQEGFKEITFITE